METITSPPTVLDQQRAKSAKIPLGWRDNCSALLIPLNICRHETLYATWKCDDHRHIYEKCQYDDYMSRMKGLALQEKKAKEDAE